MSRDYKFDTLALHAGHEPDPATGSRAVPIYQTTSFCFDSTEHAARLFALEEGGNIYTRLQNPTNTVLEERIAALDGGIGALAVASGQAAETIAIMNLVKAGDHIVSSSNLYGGTYTLLHYTLRKMGVETTFVDPSDIANFQAAIKPNTKLVYAETLGNPSSDMLDIEAVAKVAHENCIPLIIDNTFATPYLCRPIEYGADIVIYSATKFLGGHGTSIGGLIVDSGKFDWSSGKFPEYCSPDSSYHGMNFYETFGQSAYIVKARVQLLRDLGPAMSPFNAFLILLGIETLSLRMRRHCENAIMVARFLDGHPAVNWVSYTGLDSHPTHQIARKYMKNGYGAIFGFGIKGGKEAGIKFINSVELLSHLANVGDAKSLVIHPASTTHQQLTEEEQIASGVTPDFIRLSIGLEDIDDILTDIDNALQASQK